MHPSLTRTRRWSLRAITGVIALALVAAACGGDDASTPEPAAAVAVADQAALPAAPSTVAVLSDALDLGNVLVGPDGLTLYGFLNDVDATSACYGTCADAWPPVVVGPDWTVGPGLDSGIFNTVIREDGSQQLVAGKWPLYYFAGDAVPGDVNGQGSGDVWFVVGTDGRLIEGDSSLAQGPVAEEGAEEQPAEAVEETPAQPAIVSTATSDLGEILVDANGLSLYGFTNDTDGQPTCEGACADAWPPVIVDSPDLPAGLDPEVFSIVERPDGTLQLRAGVWPLYLFAGDGAPGDINGQSSGDVWFLATPEGGLIRGDGEAAAATEADTGSGY